MTSGDATACDGMDSPVLPVLKMACALVAAAPPPVAVLSRVPASTWVSDSTANDIVGLYEVLLPEWISRMQSAAGLQQFGASGCKGPECAQRYRCVAPTGRSCNPTVPGSRCMGYTQCRDRVDCIGKDNNAMCMYKGDGTAEFDVCTCRAIYPIE